MWVNFTAVELWFSQVVAYIFNREVASKDTKQCFLFALVSVSLAHNDHRACAFARLKLEVP
jgi:hypothetical protein